MSEEPKGLYGKYHITKVVDGSIVDDAFVLRPGRDPHARVALLAYAASVRDENPQLASELAEMARPQCEYFEVPLDGACSVSTAYPNCQLCQGR